MSGVKVDPLPWDSATSKELYEELVRSELFDKAYHVASFPNSGKLKSEVHDLSLLQDLIAQPKVPPLVRARLLQWQATLALESGNTDEWLALSSETEGIFREEGHRGGLLSLELERLHQHPREKLPLDELEAATTKLKDAFRELGDWDSVKSCMRKLSEIAIHGGSDALLTALDAEYDEMRTHCMSTIDWNDKEEMMLRYWDFHKHHTSKLAKSFEELYDILAAGDMPLRAAMVAMNLHKLYQDVGDNLAAERWAEKMIENVGHGSLPTLYSLHPLIRRLDGTGPTGNSLPLDDEVAQLSQFLTERKEVSAEQVGRFERGQIINSIFYVQPLYSHRPFPEYKQLSNMCFAAIRGLMSRLTSEDLVVYSAKLSGQVGSLLFAEAAQTVPPPRELLVDCYNTYAEAIGMLESVEHRGDLELTGLYAGLGQAAQNLWSVASIAADYGTVLDPEFQEADEHFRASLLLAAKEEQMSAVQLAVARLHGLWFYGAKFTTISKADNDVVESSRNQCHVWLTRAKKFLEAERRDHSTLGRKSSAATGKQSTRATLAGTSLYKNAFKLAMLMASPRYLWGWVQDSKARSVSDLLALGTNIPETLREAIEKNPAARKLFEEEESIKKRLEASEGASAIVLHQQLDSLREVMAKDELADAVLALREGRPTTLEALKATAQMDAEPASIGAIIRTDTRLEKLGLHRAGPKRQVFFVDYGFHDDAGFVLVALGDEVSFYWTSVSLQEATEWKESWLAQQPPETPTSPGADGPEPYYPRLRDEEDAALALLSRLVKPLVTVSAPGDLLVLCPSESIHGIPLHAARTGPEDEGTVLIERNPVVYAASMTVTEQCMARAATRPPSPAAGGANTLLSAFRHPGAIRDMGARISAQFHRPLDVQAGERLERGALQAACAGSKTVLFFGHCDPGSRPVEQHLLLDDGGSQTRKLPLPADIFTVDDVFATRVTASLLTLVACGSAAQTVRPGDEPLGLLTALLCSWANSVVGTMWPVEARAGVAFAEAFYRRLAMLAEPRGPEDEEDGPRDDPARRRMIDLAVVLQETVVELKRSRRQGYNTENVVHWGAFTLNGAWLLDV